VTAAPADYRPPWWLRGRHLQSLWGPLRRRPRRPAFRRERWETPDGDFLDLDWLAAAPARPAAPCVVVLHGLEGSSESHYALGLMGLVEDAGWRGVVVHFRSCSGELNRLGRLYHSGETSDLEFVVRRLIAATPGAAIGLTGVSLGGNVVLKWLGERGETVPDEVLAAVAISVPFDLAACAAVLDHGLNRLLYTAHFLRTMKPKVRAKAALYGERVDVRAAMRARTFRLYDRLVTAPIFGFSDEEDYWRRCSSGPYLSKIRRHTLLISAVNDPFVPPESLPRAEVERSPWLEAVFPAEGGHAGFLDGGGAGPSWAERRAVDFLARHLGPSARMPQ
jgi:predicted alpha/beta-fold hydrolase